MPGLVVGMLGLELGGLLGSVGRRPLLGKTQMPGYHPRLLTKSGSLGTGVQA